MNLDTHPSPPPSSPRYKYMGLQYSKDCFCGDTYYTSERDAIPTDQCNMPCSGDDELICGGPWANSIFIVGDPDKMTAEELKVKREMCWGGGESESPKQDVFLALFLPLWVDSCSSCPRIAVKYYQVLRKCLFPCLFWLIDCLFVISRRLSRTRLSSNESTTSGCSRGAKRSTI